MGNTLLLQLYRLKILKHKQEKILLDIKFKKACKQGNLLPTFAKVQLSTKNVNYKLKQRIGRIIMEDELQRKHHEKEKLKKDIKALRKRY